MKLRFISTFIAISAIAIVVAYSIFYLIFLDLFVDLWWFRSANFEGYFWLRFLYQYLMPSGITIFFFTIFFFHFWIASRYLSFNNVEDDALYFNIAYEQQVMINKKKKYQQIVDLFMAGSLWIYTPLSLILAIVIAVPFYQQWESVILFFFGESAGILDPIFGNDISFYMFSYPIYSLIQQELLMTALILLVAVALLYGLTHTLIPNQKKDYPLGAKIHLIVLLGFVVLFITWGFVLQRFDLLYTNNHQPVFFGPGFVEIRYYLPLIWLKLLSFLSFSLAISVYLFSNGQRSAWPIGGCTLAFLSFVGLTNLPTIPSFLEKYIVRSNPVDTEKSYMKNNIEATLAAYKLDKVKIIDSAINLHPTKNDSTWKNQKSYENIPLWDREILVDVYQQLQGIRPYYNFLYVDEARYLINNRFTQVNLAARELNLSKLPDEAKSWENEHMRYTHGYGAVMTPASQDAEKPIEWYLRDLDLRSDVGFKINQPNLYYGQEKYQYAIVPNKLKAPKIATTDGALSEDYAGKGGVPIQSLLRKMLFAFYFHDEKIFFSSNISKTSKMLFRRNIVKRVNALAPFLHLDKDPYLVITADRLYWILDAYTLSDWYPVSKPSTDYFSGKKQQFNYIRNSIKITIDGYDGSTNFYIADKSDAIVQAYSRAYPGVFKDLDAMPATLKKQLRYPRDFYYWQMQVYAKYHQKQPELFYQQAETWEFATIGNKQVKPYYVTARFDNCKGKEEFVLLNPMTPINRDNLSVIAVASTLDQIKCNDDYNAGISIYQYKKYTQINGLAQVDALIDQDSAISSQFTLWDQRGSEIIRGRMVVLPMADTVLYVLPIYISSTRTRIPRLTRIIASNGDKVVMANTLKTAFAKLQK